MNYTVYFVQQLLQQCKIQQKSGKVVCKMYSSSISVKHNVNCKAADMYSVQHNSNSLQYNLQGTVEFAVEFSVYSKVYSVQQQPFLISR